MLPEESSIHAITAQKMRAINRTAVLELIHCRGPIPPSKIAAELHLSLSTVKRIVEDLKDEGLVQKTAIEEWSGGRGRSLVKFNGSDHLIIGIDLGGTKIYGAVADLDGKIVYEMHFDHHQTHSEESLQVVYRVIDELLNMIGEKGLPVIGVGIGVPGITDSELGFVSFAPALEWQNFPLRARLKERYSFPIVVENDVNLAALGEAWFGSDGDELNNLVLMAIGTGIGAGIVINGSIYSGVHHMAGEIGYLLLERSQLGQQYPGFGAFEQITSGTGIAERARLMLANQSYPEPSERLTAEAVFHAARQHVPWAEEIIAETVDYLAQAIAAITLLYDPDVILLGGGVSRSADLLIEPIIRRLEGAIPVIPKLRVSRLGARAAVMGAIMQLLRITFN